MNFFDIDGPFQRYGTVMFDLLMVNLLWIIIILLSLGILSGPANVALYTSVNQSIRNSYDSPMRTFFRTFKNKFKVSLIGGILSMLIILTSIFSIFLIEAGHMPSWLTILYYVVIFYLILVAPYFIALVSHTDFKLKKAVKYAVILTIKHFPTSFLIIMIIGGLSILIVISRYIAAFMAVAPTFLLISYLLSGRVLTQYDLKQFK
ncbi:MAG: DUF624 domain-containing protein [Vallitaleaceae bacterium]|jgi:uncharacterized membrane protein YesL|nr:DUF624 domain-containing protein [Vallitaleaceae bacterium]